MGKFDQKMREVERSLAKLTGNKAQAARFRKGLEKKIQQAAVKALLKNQQKHGRPQNEPEAMDQTRINRPQASDE